MNENSTAKPTKVLSQLGISSVVLKSLLGVLFLSSLVFIGHGIRETLSVRGGTDFHSYWFYGHFIRQGADPYQAFFESQQPDLPITYLDGVTTQTLPVAQPNLAKTPANTAPIALLLSVFALFSWPVAKTLWLLCNLLLTLLIPWLVIKLLPPHNRLSLNTKLLICFIFYCLQGTRIANWVGQTTLLTFALMLGTLLIVNRSWILAGILLGIALSKYSLALPVFIFFLYDRYYKVLSVSLAIQILGIFIIAWLGGNSLVSITDNYLRLLSHHLAFPGIHLASLFPHSSLLANVLAGLGTLIVGGLLFKHDQASKGHQRPYEHPFENLHIITILALWTLLVAYHRAYDTVMVIWFIVLLIYGLIEATSWPLSLKQKQGLRIFLLIFVLIMSIPSSLLGLVLPAAFMPTWYTLVSYTMTVALLAALALTLWLLQKLDWN